jgi:hypothetical protein
VGSLVKLLGIKRGTEAEGDARSEKDVVGNGSCASVVDLDLLWWEFLLAITKYTCESLMRNDARIQTLAKETGSMRYLLATSRPTVLPLFEFQVALALASTCGLTL